MHVTLINPNLVFLRNDPFTTGIVYMPISLAYVAAELRRSGHEVSVVDAFGEDPRQFRRSGMFGVLGMTEEEVAGAIKPETSVIFIFANQVANHVSVIEIIKVLKHHFPEKIVVILENTQAVTAYALRVVATDFYKAGADYILTGEGELRAVRLLNSLNGSDVKKIDGLGSPDFYNAPVEKNDRLDELSFPAWDLFPVENYWRLRFAHGPQGRQRYLPLLTSRGCPYPCKFCVVPETNQQSWRARSSQNVVDEMEFLKKKFQVDEFHLEDLDSTIVDQRIQEICREIIRRDLKIVWKIVAGTKVETIRSEETIDLMARSGCRYISISPETGSPRLLKLMDKPFNLDHAIKMVKRMNHCHIRSQACFVLGFPGENQDDRAMTRELVRRLTKEGVDEVALFIVSPIPGSAIYQQFTGYRSLSELNFTPTWRADYNELARFRLALYRDFLFWKLRYHPVRIFLQILNFLTKHFETKMEMVPYRALKLMWWGLFSMKDRMPHDQAQEVSTSPV